jgi:diacylglycerol kinase (ATP)
MKHRDPNTFASGAFAPGVLAGSFRNAFHGLRDVVKTQRNAKIHLAATVAIAVVGWLCGVSRGDWCLLIFTCAGVWAAEVFNTALEILADAVTLERHPLIKRAKDAAAGAVLIMAIAAVIVGGVVFAPWVFAFAHWGIFKML